jgi:transcriptional regulator with XRE-family HTH domain
MPEKAVARRLGLPSGTFANVMRGTNGQPPGTKIRRETAELVLAYWPTLDDFPDISSIDSTGTHRRVRALATRGWSRARLAVELGTTVPNFKARLRGERVSARFARAVAGLYNRLWNERPEDHGVAAWIAERVRRCAAEDGWHGPLAWDDDTIDDPKALPQTDAPEPVATEGGNVAARWLMGESVILTDEARKEVLVHLYEWTNQTTAEIAHRLGMTPAAAEQSWNRMKKQARLEGRRLWRRVYVPRDRVMKQNEMEEAA